MLDDGKIQLRILETNGKDTVSCEVIYGGILTSRKGVNLPNTNVSIPSLTEEDLINLKFALKNNIEWIGLSFVRTANDILELKQIIAAENNAAGVIAKIEKPEAVENIDEIIAATDGIMVARGDLGVEMPLEEVPLLQKMIVQKCRVAAKPVIIATQMLESMITTARPTRAEVNDVANSVLDGADAVMLSGETSVGDFPVIVIETIAKIILHVEKNNYSFNSHIEYKQDSPNYLSDAICSSACFLAEKTNAFAIVALTASGYTAVQIASHRPKSAIFIFTSNKKLLNALSLLWGIKGFYYEPMSNTDVTITEINAFLKKNEFTKLGDVIINTGVIPITEHSKTNMLKVSVVK